MQSRRSRYLYILPAIGQSLEEKRFVDFDLVAMSFNAAQGQTGAFEAVAMAAELFMDLKNAWHRGMNREM